MSMTSNAFTAALVSLLLLAAPAAAEGNDGHSLEWEAWFTIVLIVCLLIALVLDAMPATSAMVLSSMLLYLVGIVSITELYKGMVNNGVLSIMFLFIIVTPMTQLPLMKKMVEVTLSGGAAKKTEEQAPGIESAGKDSELVAVKPDGESPEGSTEPVEPETAAVAAAAATEEPEEKKPEPVFWPTTKLVLLSVLTSSFIENTPHVAAFTPMVTKYCMEHGVAPSLLLLPMNFAVILGNYGVVGCSSNLVFSGLMEDDGYGQMDFFELIKVGGPQLPIVCLYLIVLPWFLLPRDKGGMVGLVKSGKKAMSLRMVVSSASARLIGLTVEQAKRQLAGGQSLVFEKVVRGEEEELDIASCVLQAGDIATVSGSPALLMAACQFFELDFVTANNNLARKQAMEWNTQTSNPVNHKVAEATEETATLEIEHADMQNSSFDVAKKVKLVLAECVLAAGNSATGRTVNSQAFQQMFGASIIGMRSSLTGLELEGDVLREHVLTAGDTLLLLTASTFEKDHGSNPEFLMISMITNAEEEAENYSLAFPAWFPFGIPAGETKDGKPQKKLVVLPPEYGYISLLIFVAIVIAAIFHLPLSVLCLGGAILIVMSGITTTAKAMKMVHLDVYVLIAFSFPLGSAVKNSGLANWIGLQIQYAGIEGFWLMLILVLLSVVLTNAITNKASCQVMYPIIVAIYRAQGQDPLPCVFACAYAVILALCTPYAIPPNVLVFGPGGYTGMDYLRFGLPLTVICTILTAVFAMVVYDLAW